MHRPTLIKCSPRNVKIVPTPLKMYASVVLDKTYVILQRYCKYI